MGGYRRLRDEAKRKRRFELVRMAVMGLAVATLVSVFAVILTR
jgi:hypothetical protein